MHSGIAITVVIMCLGLVSGCASLGTILPGGPASEESSEVLIAQDFADAITQLPALAPTSTTVQFERDASIGNTFLRTLQSELLASGYAVQSLAGAIGVNPITYSVSRQPQESGNTLATYELAVGSVRFRRQYHLDASNSALPAGPLFVKGADASSLVMDDSRFEQQFAEGESDSGAAVATLGAALNPHQIAARRPAAASTAKIDSTQGLGRMSPQNPLARLPLTTAVSAPLIAQAQASARSNGRSAMLGATTEQTAADLLMPYTRNVFDIGSSNFDGLLGGYRQVDEQILVFGNDSMRLGTHNKRVISAMVSQFDVQQDVMSVVGCSLGPTKLDNGNQMLALGRANRVKEALVLAGVPQGKILDEGCWAGESSRSMPSRGVVITHRREQV